MGLNTTALHQENVMDLMVKLADNLLNYRAAFPDVVLTYHASDMILCMHSDASFLS